MKARGALAGERKTVTALFADMVSSTALIHDLDPEDAHRLIEPVLALMMDAVHHYQGYVAKSIGDGILALFGAPIAHEDHPQRALYAALRMQDEVRSYADRLRLAQGIALQIRVGVNSGEVVVRAIHTDDLHTDYDPVGHTIHIASRMERVALPGSVVASDYTHKLAQGYFAFNALGATPIKGLPEPLPVFEVLGLGPLRTRLQVSASRGLARFVGRSEELRHLAHAFSQAMAGRGTIVGVVGEPGVGKSRLFHEFKLRAPRSCLVLETVSVSHGKAYPYLPLIELLKSYCQIDTQDDERRRREKVTGKVLTLDRALEDCLPYLFYLLGGEEPASSLTQMDPQIRRQRTFEAIRRLFVRASEDEPIEVIIEDLQWLDSETKAFLDFFSEGMADTRILLLVNFRPEYRHDWGDWNHYTQLRLDPLGENEARDLLQALLGDAASLAPLKQLILEKTEGNPFFIEEVVQTLIEEQVLQGVCGQYSLEQNPAALHIPASVQAVLAARIDRLQPAEKALLQTLAVVGKAFSWSLLARLVDGPEGELKNQLARLQDSEFIYEQPAFPEVLYSFKHALTQEVAYGSLLSERRRALHERAGHAIEALFGAQLEEHYSELAHHFSRSGNTQKAVEYLGCAGRLALQRSADSEAVQHLSTALAMLETLPESQERAQQELDLRVTIGPALMASKGLAVPELKTNYTRALALSRQLGETSFASLLGLRTFYVVSGALRTARELGEQLVALAEKAKDPALLAQAHRALGSALFSLGELAPARVQLEQALALYDRRQHYPVAFYSGLEPGVLGQAYLALDLWLLGYPDQALVRIQDALALARTLSSPAVAAPALTFAAELYLNRREARRTGELAESVVSLGTEHGFPHWISYGTILSGWALADEGRRTEGMERMKEGLAAYRATGGELWLPHFLSLLGESYGRAGQAESGLEIVDEALALVDRTEERVYEADLHRLKGELMLMVPDHHTVEASFLKAAAIAHRQNARLLELQALTALGRLWRQQGKLSDARQRLTAIYGWFTEGFDTAPVREARMLLDELR